MNIYIDARALQKPNWQGEQVYVYSLIRAMAELGSEHHFHLHFGGETWSDRLSELASLPNITAHRCAGRLWSHASIPIKILRTGSRVYFRMYNEYAPMPVPVPCPVAVLIHDLRHLQPDVSGPATPPKDNASDYPHVRKFDHIITVSNTVKREISTLFHIASERVTVACNAVDLTAAMDAQLCPKGFNGASRFFLMVNPGGAHKNWSDTLNAYSLYRAAHPGSPISLVLAGSLHHEADAIHARIRADPHLAACVACLGFVDDAELRYLYAHACGLVCPSRYEGFGRPILEAMIYGTPVIASDIPVFREVAGDAALHVPLDNPSRLADALSKIQDDSALRRTLALRARRQFESFSWEISATNTLNALEMLANSGFRQKRFLSVPSVSHRQSSTTP